MGEPIRDALVADPPHPLIDRPVFAQANELTTFRVPGDRKRSEANRWFASTRHPVRSDNEVKYFIDGPDTFADMAAAISTAKREGHFIYMLGWSMFIDCPLAQGGTLRQLFMEASARGVQLTLLVEK